MIAAICLWTCRVFFTDFQKNSFPGWDVSVVSAHYFVRNALNALKLCKKCTECAGYLTKKKRPYTVCTLQPPVRQQLLIPLRHLSLSARIFPVNLRCTLILAVNICKICDFSGAFFNRILLVAVKNAFYRIQLVALNFFPPHSAGRGEKFSFTA